jgi:hypothetical protein
MKRDQVGWADQSGLGRTRAGLDDLGSFGSRDEALVFLGEQLKMLIAHKVSPSELPTIIGKGGSKRAKFRASCVWRIADLLGKSVIRHTHAGRVDGGAGSAGACSLGQWSRVHRQEVAQMAGGDRDPANVHRAGQPLG